MEASENVKGGRDRGERRSGEQRPRERSRRRRAERDAAWLADTLSSGGRAGADSMRAVFRVLDEALRTVEEVAWEVRGLADEVSDVWKEVVPKGGTEGAPESGAPARFQRMASTAWMLGQVAVSYRAHAFRSAFVPRSRAKGGLERVHAANARRFYETSVEQGGAFLKVGQLLSARHDILPRAWVTELSKLQDDVPAVPFTTARAIVEAELGPLGAAFERFEEVPVAAASIGQVHRARTSAGEDVAVKVQRPGVGALIAADLDLLSLFLEAVRSMLPPTDLEAVESEIRETVLRETDYVLEAEMMDRAASFFDGHPDIVVPRVVKSCSGQRVLVSRFVEGRKITEALDELAAARDAGDREAGARLDRLMTVLLEAYVRMVLEAGVFQADPHPGNLLVTPDDRLVILDFGASRALDDAVRRRYLGLFQAFMSGDRERLGMLLGELGFRTRSGAPDTLLAFADALLDQMRQALQGGELRWPTREQLMGRAAGLLRQAERDPVEKMPREFVMIARVFGTLGGLFAHYRPHLDPVRALMPVLGTIAAGQA